MLTPRNSTGGSVSTEPPEWDSSVDGFYPLVWRWVTTLAWIQTSAGNSSGERSNTWRKDDAWERLTEIEFWKGRVLLWLTCNWGWCYFLSLSYSTQWLDPFLFCTLISWHYLYLCVTCVIFLLSASNRFISLSNIRKKGKYFFYLSIRSALFLIFFKRTGGKNY